MARSARTSGTRRGGTTAAAATQASGAYISQMRSVSALVNPPTAEMTMTIASATATGSRAPRAFAAYHVIGRPRNARKAAGEPKSQNAYGRSRATDSR